MILTPREKNLADIGRIASRHGFTADDILGPSRTAKLVRARQDCVTMFRDRGHSTTEIGRIINRDHSTIVHTLQRIQKLPEIYRSKSFKLPDNAGTSAGLL